MLFQGFFPQNISLLPKIMTEAHANLKKKKTSCNTTLKHNVVMQSDLLASATANFNTNKDNFRTLSSQGLFESIVINLYANDSGSCHFRLLHPKRYQSRHLNPEKVRRAPL